MSNALRFSLLAAAIVAVAPTAADAGCPVPGFKYAAFGDVGDDLGGGGSVDNYDSSTGSAPFTPSCDASGGNIGTNSISSATVKVSGGSDICANVEFGPGGAASTVVVVNGSGSSIAGANNCSTSSCVAQTSTTTLTPVTVPPTGTNQGDKSGTRTLAPDQTYGTVTGSNGDTITLQAGVYVIANLDMKSGSTLLVGSAPVSIYITSTIDVSGSLTNTSQKATDLVFYAAAAVTTVKINSAGTATAFGLYAPNADITLNGSAAYYGAMVGKTVKITGGGALHYDKALSRMTTSALSCGATEVSRATPIIASIYNGTATSTCSVQGSFEIGVGPAKTVAVPADITSFEFPFVYGHLRARKTSDLSTTALSFNDTSATPVFDAAKGIPTVTTSGCAKNAGRFTTTCRNVFTNTNAAATTGTTWHPTVTSVDDTSTNAAIVGPLLTSGLTGFALTDWQSLIKRVLKGTTGGTIAKLGGVDRSTVAVIGPSSVAGKIGNIGDATARPSMAYFGGQDGMLHAVCASSGGTTGTGTGSASGITNYCVLGQELWAFIPRVQLPLIRQNKARIDGSVRVVDVFGDFTTAAATGTRSWRTILTFQTGYADSTAKPAVYAIDVTDPSQPTVMWEYTAPSSAGTSDLGIGLAMHAGPTLIGGAITNLAIAQTNNGGSANNTSTNAGAGTVVSALSLEKGTLSWRFTYSYPNSPGPRSVAGDLNSIPATGIPGGVVGVDLFGNGFTTHVAFGDLYGNLWMLKAATGTSSTGSATTPVFSFSTNRHPIGALPAIIGIGTTKVAAFGSGGYADTSTTNTPWSTGAQSLIGVKLTTTTTTAAAETATSGTSSAAPLAFKSTLSTSGENVAGQVLAVGNQVFFLTDNSNNINATTYGNTATATGHSYSLDFTATSPTIVTVATDSGNTTRGGASGLANNGTTFYGGSSDKTQALSGTATTTVGTSVDYTGNKKTSRMVWIRNTQ